MNELSLVALFYHVDEFCNLFEKIWQQHLIQNQARS